MAESSSREGLRILVVSAQAEIQDQVEAALATGPARATVHWVAEPDLAVTRAQDVLPQIVVVDLLAQAPVALEIIRQFSVRLPDVAVIALVPADDVVIARDAVLAGARGFLPAPLREDELKNTVRQIIGQVAPRRPAEASSAPAGRVVVFCGPKGGTGRTTLAVNIALAMQESLGQHLLLVDADYAAPAVDVVLNLRPDRTIKDLLPRLAQVDREILAGILTLHASGLRLLLAAGEGDGRGIPSPLQVEMLIPVLRRLSPWVLVDLGLPIDEMAYAFLDAADAVVVSINPEMIGLRNARLLLEKLQSRGYARGKIWLVLNRVGLPGGLTQAELEGRLGFPVCYLIPNDQVLATVAVNTGQPMVITQRRSPVARACRGLALSLIDGAPLEAAQGQPAAALTPAGIAPEPVAPSVAPTMAAPGPEAPLVASEIEFPGGEAAAEPTQPAASAEPAASVSGQHAVPDVPLSTPSIWPVPAEAEIAATAGAEYAAAFEPPLGARAPALLLDAATLVPTEADDVEASQIQQAWRSALAPVLKIAPLVLAIVLLAGLAGLGLPLLLGGTLGPPAARFVSPTPPASALQPVALAGFTATPMPAAATMVAPAATGPVPALTPSAPPAPSPADAAPIAPLPATANPASLPAAAPTAPTATNLPATASPASLPAAATSAPTATNLPAATATSTATDTPEATPTTTATATPAATAAATATRTPTRRPSATPPPAPSPSPAPPAAHPPTLLAPAAGAGVGGVVEFRWQPIEPLPAGTGYEVVWWTLNEDPANARGIAPPTTAAALSANVDVLYSSGQVTNNTIYWTVLVVQVTPYVRLTQPGQSSPQQVVYQSAGGGGALPPPKPR